MILLNITFQSIGNIAIKNRMWVLGRLYPGITGNRILSDKILVQL